jgi:hypothetical protein
MTDFVIQEDSVRLYQFSHFNKGHKDVYAGNFPSSDPERPYSKLVCLPYTMYRLRGNAK